MEREKGYGTKFNIKDETSIDFSGEWAAHHLGHAFWAAFFSRNEEKIKEYMIRYPELFVKDSTSITPENTNSLAYRCLVLSKKQ